MQNFGFVARLTYQKVSYDRIEVVCGSISSFQDIAHAQYLAFSAVDRGWR
jgi:hypothetical protein